MKLPIIVISDGSNFDFVYSIRDAEVEMEPIDVKENLYEVFDAEGIRLLPTTVRTKRSFFGNLEIIELSETTEDCSVSLRTRLIDFYLDCGLDAGCLNSFDLSELVEIGKLFFYENFRKHNQRSD